MKIQPRAIDPLLGRLAPRALASPLLAATSYGVLATLTSVIAAALEGRLVGTTKVYWGSQELLVHPLLSNVSTILDFVLLNPLVTYFLLRSRRVVLQDPVLSGTDTVSDRFVLWLVSLSCLALSAVIMVSYAHSFLYGQFFDAIVTISARGECFITVTGWVVFFWTGLFTYVVLTGALHQVRYVVRICGLDSADIVYDPLHEDGAAGMRVLATPALEFTKASLSLLAIGLVFWLYDRLMTHATLTDRTTSIGIFTLIVFPLFAIPIARLHSLMRVRREDLLKTLFGGEPRGLRRILVRGTRRRSHSLKQLADETDATDKLRAAVLALPTWPMPTRTLVSCSAYFVSLSAPVARKLAPLLADALGLTR